MDLSKVCLTNDLFNIWTNSAAGIVVVLIVAIVIGLAIFQKACDKATDTHQELWWQWHYGWLQDGDDNIRYSSFCVPCTVEQIIAKQNELQEVISSGQYGQV